MSLDSRQGIRRAMDPRTEPSRRADAVVYALCLAMAVASAIAILVLI